MVAVPPIATRVTARAMWTTRLVLWVTASNMPACAQVPATIPLTKKYLSSSMYTSQLCQSRAPKSFQIMYKPSSNMPVLATMPGAPSQRYGLSLIARYMSDRPLNTPNITALIRILPCMASELPVSIAHMPIAPAAPRQARSALTRYDLICFLFCRIAFMH